ncbi:hypothetical protein [Pseudoalteromonas phage J2-1_QLiu-2017]|nr:hypothetical protein [Pseudoalteromonas phage J2-1_QLiu-2017]
MGELILGFLTSWLFVGILLGIATICVFADSDEGTNFWMGTALVMAAIVSPWTIGQMLIVFLAYLAVGAIWSVVKVKLAATDAVDRYKSGDISERDFDFLVDLQRQKVRISSYIIAWPLSIIATLIGDVAMTAFRKVRESLTNVYASIFEDAKNKAKLIK